MTEKVTYNGSCHCGKVKWKAVSDKTLTVIHCNCSMCIKKQNDHVIVRESDFTLLQGSEYLSTYTFNTNAAKHQFCSVCGVQSFYRPRSNLDGVGIMPHCIDSPAAVMHKIIEFDGKNWEESMSSDKGDTIKSLSSK